MDLNNNEVEHAPQEEVKLHMDDGNPHYISDEDEKIKEEEDENEEFWTPGPDILTKVRQDILISSIKATYKRLEASKTGSQTCFEDVLQFRRMINDNVSNFDVYGSNILSKRAVSIVKFSSNGKNLAIGSWSGDLKIISAKTLQPDVDIKNPVKHYNNRVHNKISDIDWYPLENSQISIVAANSNDLSVLLWNYDDKEPVCVMKGHEARITGTRFHPSGKYIASSSFDKTWRLHDIEMQKELYLQEGHSKEIYCLAFQNDGALLASGGSDAICKVWDLRTGKEIMSLCDHIRDVTCIDWSDNCYQLATGGKDGTIKIWDLRFANHTSSDSNSYSGHIYNNQPLYTIPAHNKLVSDLKFFHKDIKTDNIASYLKSNTKINSSSKFLISSSYDGTLKLWAADNWIHLGTLRGHTDDKIMSCDINSSGDMIASSGWDKSVRLWSHDESF